MADVTLDVALDASGAQKSLKNFQGSAQKSLSNIESSFASLKTVAAAAVGIFAGRAIIGGIKAVTDAAAIQEDAINALNSSLTISGRFSEETSKSFQVFASELQSVTKFGDEAILQNAALIQSLGNLDDKGLRRATTAAADLSAALGIDLNTAATLVGKAAAGEVGSFSRFGVSIKKAGTDAETFERALVALNSKFGGAAAAQVNTFSGATTQLSNTFGDLLEEIGFLITNNPVLINSFKDATKGISDLIKGIKDGSGELDGFITTFADIGSRAIPFVIGSFKTFLSAVNGIKTFLDGFSIGVIALFNNIRLGMLTVVGTTFSAVTTLTKFIDSKLGTNISKSFDFSEAIEENNAAINTTNNLLEGLSERYAGLREPVEKVTKRVGEFKKSSEDAFKAAKKGAQGLSDEAKKAAKAIKDGVIKQTGTLIDENSKLRNSISKIGKTTNEQIDIELKFQKLKIDNTIASLDLTKDENIALRDQLEIKKGLLDQEASKKQSGSPEAAAGESAGSGFLDIVSGGFDTAANLFSNIVGGGFISSAGDFISGLQNLPETFAGIFDKFDDVALGFTGKLEESFGGIIEKIPAVISKALGALKNIGSAIINALPGLVSVLAEGAVDLVDVLVNDLIPKLIKKLPQVLNSVLKAVPRLISTLAKSLGPLVRSVIISLIDIVKVLAQNLGPIITSLTEGVLTAIPEIIIALVDELILKGGLARIAFALAKAMAIDLPLGIAKGILNALSNLGGKVFGDLGKVFSSGIKFPSIKLPTIPGLGVLVSLFTDPPFIRQIKAVFASFNPFGGGGGGFLGQIGSAVGGAFGGFALGGTVPNGFPNDSFPAMLTSGEEVISMDRVKRLDDFLDSQSSGGGQVVIQLQVGEQELAEVMYNLNRKGFRTA